VRACRGSDARRFALVSAELFARRFEKLTSGDRPMTLHVSLEPAVALVAGILILLMPRLLNMIVAIYLIVIGVVGLTGWHI
jgi:hypothetical protein